VLPALSVAQEDRFVVSPDANSVTTFDLNTVQIVQPGRFSIVQTETYQPDVMAFALNAQDILGKFCAQPDGKYPPPRGLLSLGPPDMPVQNIEVMRDSVVWQYPYRRLAYRDEQKLHFLICRGEGKTQAQWFLEQRAEITNGKRMKYLFDCTRGMSGHFFPGSDDPAKAMMSFVKPDTMGEAYYERVCLAVTKKMPYPAKPTAR